MRNVLVPFCTASLLALLVGCSADSTAANTDAAQANAPANGTTNDVTGKTTQATTILQGTFGEKSLGLDNARVVAITDDQTSYWSHLDAHGDFKLEVPVGASYRVVFANQLAAGGQVKLGALSFKTSSGESEWFSANTASTIDVGFVTSTGSGGGDPANHDDDASCQKDDGSAKQDPAASAGVNVCLIWPSVKLSSSVKIDDAFADVSVHSGDKRDDDQTCGYWKIDGGILWGAPAAGLGLGYGSFEAGVNIGISSSTKMDLSWDSSLESSYSWNSSWDSSWTSSWNSNWSSNYQSSWSSSWNSSMGIAGTVGLAGGVKLGSAFSYESKYESNYESKFEVGGVVGGGKVESSWHVSSSSSFKSEVSGGVCVTANACNTGLACVAGKCVEKK